MATPMGSTQEPFTKSVCNSPGKAVSGMNAISAAATNVTTRATAVPIAWQARTKKDFKLPPCATLARRMDPSNVRRGSIVLVGVALDSGPSTARPQSRLAQCRLGVVSGRCRGNDWR